VDTSAIGQRVTDFLKKHAPFQDVDEADLLALAATGRVRFHEPHDFILWQGQPLRMQVLVIQQGTVTLWDEAGEQPALRDVRGAGDILGLEQFNDVDVCLYSARSSSDVVIYSFPAIEFESLILRYPSARQFIAAQSGGAADAGTPDEPTEPLAMPLQRVLRDAHGLACRPEDTVRDAALMLVNAGAEACAVVDASGRIRGTVTSTQLLKRLAEGNDAGDRSVASVPLDSLRLFGPDATIAQGALALADGDSTVAAMTEDGTPTGSLQGLVTTRELAAVFGDDPVSLLRSCRYAATPQALADLNRRSRAFILRHLTSTAAVDWIVQFAHRMEVAIVSRAIALTVPQAVGCWCFFGASGRLESLTGCTPDIALVLPLGGDTERGNQHRAALLDGLASCGFIGGAPLPFEPAFYVATVDEWTARFTQWVEDPIRQQTYRARALFDLRPVLGPATLCVSVSVRAEAGITRDFVHVMANDCLASLPPLTFFEDAVVDNAGERTGVFKLEETALRPLVDVGRVFGMARRKVMGLSTDQRINSAGILLLEHEAMLLDALETLRVVLRQQGRVGLMQGTDGAVFPPSLLSPYDRHILKSRFRSIHRLLEFTANLAWLDELM
jgi:CBS domain-containing protein